jgi:hypothetical protein
MSSYHSVPGNNLILFIDNMLVLYNILFFYWIGYNVRNEVHHEDCFGH